MKLPIHTAVIIHDEGATQYVSASHGELIERIGGWCRAHWASVSDKPPPADVRNLIDAYFYDNVEDSLEVTEDSIDLPGPYASASEMLAMLKDVTETPKHGEPEPSDPEFNQDWEAEMGRYAIARLHELIDCARAVIAKASVPTNSPEPLKVGDRVRIAPAWQDPGDDQYDRVVIKAPADSTRVCIQTFIPGFLIQPVEWIEADKLVLLTPSHHHTTTEY